MGQSRLNIREGGVAQISPKINQCVCLREAQMYDSLKGVNYYLSHLDLYCMFNNKVFENSPNRGHTPHPSTPPLCIYGAVFFRSFETCFSRHCLITTNQRRDFCSNDIFQSDVSQNNVSQNRRQLESTLVRIDVSQNATLVQTIVKENVSSNLHKILKKKYKKKTP